MSVSIAPARMRVMRRSLALVLALCFFTALTSSAYGAVIPFSAYPAPEFNKSNAGYFQMQGRPGQTIETALMLRNRTDKAVTLAIYPCDSRAAVYGGVDYTRDDESVSGVGTWIQLPVSSVTVPAKGEKRVPFKIAVPSDARAGENIGGVAVYQPEGTKSSTTKSGNDSVSTKINTITRMVVAVVVDVPGAERNSFAINSVTATTQPDGMYLKINLENTGTTLNGGKGKVTIAGGELNASFDMLHIPPGSVCSYPVRWKKDPAAGTYQVHVTFKPEKGKTVTWDGEIVIGAEDVAEIAHRVPGVAEKRADQTRLYWIIGISVAALLIAVIIAAIVLARRSNKKAVAKALAERDAAALPGGPNDE